MNNGPVGVALVGAGVISKQYLTNLTSFPDLNVVAVTDIVDEAATQRAEEFGVPVSGAPSVAYEHPDVEIVVNLTIPSAHHAVSMAAIAGGKHVFNEKPLTANREEARELLAAAEAGGVRVGAAPDTFLGPGLQTSFTQIRDGSVGTPLTGLFLFQSAGPEPWHPNPAFFYLPGAGPLFDIGPYYLTTLVQALGPVAEVAALGSTSHSQRVVGSGPKQGETFDVHVPTHVGVLLRFEGGQSAQGILSFQSPLPRGGFVEVSGTEAVMALPDPNRFDGEIRLRRPGTDDWEATVIDEAKATRGTGTLEMARAIRQGIPHRASGELAYHVLDIMCSVEDAVASGGYVSVESTVEPAQLLPDDWDPHVATV